METRIIETIEGLESIGPSWRAIDDDQPETPFSTTFDYVVAWARARVAAGNTTLSVIAAEDSGELVGVLPLALTRRSKGPVSFLELAFITEGDHRDVVVDARRVSAGTTIKALLQAALTLDHPVRRVSLRYLPSRSPLTHYLLKSPEHNTSVRPLVELPRIELRRHPNFAEYRRTVPRSVVKSANRLRRELGMSLEVVSPVTASLFEELTAQHRREQRVLNAQGDRRDRRSLFDDPVREQAYREITLGSDAAMAFVARSSAGDLLFHDLAWRRGTTVLAWNTAYNPDFADLKPSRARLDAIEWMFGERGIDVFDLGTGRYPWKYQLTPDFAMAYEYGAWLGEGRLTRLLEKLRP